MDLDDKEEPTPFDGWTIVTSAFDRRRDPNDADDFGTIYEPGHGRLLAELDVTVDASGRQHGLIQFVHRAFATSVLAPRLAALLANVWATIAELQQERAYLEVEHYEDGYTLFGVLLDADGLDRLEMRITSAG